jgi:PST family polysaccharide transporter
MSKNYKGKLFSNFFSLSIIQGTNYLIPILVMPFVIHRIGVGLFGVVSIAQVIMVYLSTVSEYGFNLTATRDIVLNREVQGTDKISRIFSTVLFTKLAITAIAFLVLILLIILVPFFKSNFNLYVSGFTYVIGQSLLVSWFFQGMEKMKFITYSILLARIIFAVLIFIFINKPGDAYLFLFFFGLGNIIAGIFSIYTAMYIFKLKLLVPLRSDVVYELWNGWQIMISNLSINTYLYSNIFILRIFASDMIVGYYSIAEKIFFAVRQILGIFSQVVYPHICQLVQTGKDQTAIFFKKIYLPFLLLVSIASCSVFILSPWLTQIFVDKEANLPGILLRMLSLVPIIVCLNIPAYQILLAFDHKKSYLRILTLGTIINLGANILLANLWEAPGTVLAIIITEIFITIGLNWELYKNNLTEYIKLRTI